jgi:prophage DNA circulation protein
MKKPDSIEATPILIRAVQNLLAVVNSSQQAQTSLAGSTFRTACGAVIADAQALIQNDLVGTQLIICFDLAIAAGVTQPQLQTVCDQTLSETPRTLGAKMVTNQIINLCLAEEALAIANMTFVSREDVDALKLLINGAFQGAEEIAADDMDQMVYRGLVALHASIIYHLTTVEHPLPKMLSFQFAKVMPSLTMANRLYGDGGRADQLRDENKIIHPAFMPATGRALSF